MNRNDKKIKQRNETEIFTWLSIFIIAGTIFLIAFFNLLKLIA